METVQCNYDQCTDQADLYLEDMDVYICTAHHEAELSTEPAVPLTEPESVRKVVRVVKEALRSFVSFTEVHFRGRVPPDYQNVFQQVETEIQRILSDLHEALTEGFHYKVASLLEDSTKLEERLRENELYVTFSVKKTWRQAEIATTMGPKMDIPETFQGLRSQISTISNSISETKKIQESLKAST
ncbi:unnamed protein product [Moneuplotes crassus]|uniref:Uncharacterized protein n=1 Tax=Euplotes crassus TaxID=5936 RepID=A0AAD1UG15_EUPCR|nr:unnamed protein product [Moneuplotes crassus]